ncbi:MAG: oligosaccharide flippase family protein, partial [Rubrobacteridae bacterium]|nr:oligosaccharide flippase family protein [Rubrobacteridae bacterium]
MTSIKKASLIAFLNQVFVVVIGLITSIILARTLGPHDRGVLALLIFIPGVFASFGSLGLEVAAIFYSANREFELLDIIGNAIIATVALTVAILTIIFILYQIPFFHDYLEHAHITLYLFAISISTIPFLIINNNLSKILLGREEMFNYGIVTSIPIFSQFLFYLVILLTGEERLIGAITSYLLSIVTTTFFCVFFIKKLSAIKLSFNPELLRKSIHYGGRAYIGDIAQSLNYRLDMFIVSYFLSAVSVGYYSVAVGIVEKIWLIPNALGMVLFPRTANNENDDDESLTPRMTRNTALILVMLSILLALIIKPLV